MGWAFSRTGISILVVCSLLTHPIPLWADDPCVDPILQSTASSETVQIAESLLVEVAAECSTNNVCTDVELQAQVASAVAKIPPKQASLFRKILRLPRRALVLLIWGSSILGPGVLSFYATAGAPEGIRISFSSFVMVMSGVLFGRFSGPIEKKLGPWIETKAFKLWDPAESDGWGQIMKNLSEADRLKFSQIYNQLIVLRPYLKQAGEALSRGDIDTASRQYLNAVLCSSELFGGLNLADPNTLREVRAYLPELDQILSTTRSSVVERAVERVKRLRADELGPRADRKQIAEVVRRVLTRWLDA